MLAYVFWHWRRPDAGAERYEELQRRFHVALRAAPPAGFLSSRSAAMVGAPWARGGAEAYEDWYLVENSAALDPLNDAAVTASRQAPHDAAAAVAEGGAAGLYRLRLGDPVDDPRAGVWFSKPAGMSYAVLYGALEPLVRDARAALWCRQMVLGPGPEFCLQSRESIQLPAPFTVCEIPLRGVWPL